MKKHLKKLEVKLVWCGSNRRVMAMKVHSTLIDEIIQSQDSNLMPMKIKKNVNVEKSLGFVIH